MSHRPGLPRLAARRRRGRAGAVRPPPAHPRGHAAAGPAPRGRAGAVLPLPLHRRAGQPPGRADRRRRRRGRPLRRPRGPRHQRLPPPQVQPHADQEGREAARDSQHARSQAIDFALVGVKADKLYKYALKRWKGGVGYYPVSQFVHLDTGKRRTWKGH
ncbi:YcbK family protein [Nannocystis pusilla]|uniref:YcbK family protein n=1 Tax=Nannocystis pusilla TaxID=889268 RepID=UPI003B7C9D9E